MVKNEIGNKVIEESTKSDMKTSIYTVEPRYSELIGGVVCSDSKIFGLSEKTCRDSNAAFGETLGNHIPPDHGLQA